MVASWMVNRAEFPNNDWEQDYKVKIAVGYAKEYLTKERSRMKRCLPKVGDGSLPHYHSFND